MAKRRVRSTTTERVRQRETRRKQQEQAIRRQMLLEKLECRHLLAGAQLIGVQPSDGDLIALNGLTELNVAPRDVTLRFNEFNDQRFDPATIPTSIRVTSAGPDMLLGTTDDLRIVPGYIGANDAPNENEIVIRFAETPPDDLYRIEIFSLAGVVPGVTALETVNGAGVREAFNPAGLGTDRATVDFRLNLGAKVISVVPEPIGRNPSTGLLEQRNDIIQVFFNDDDLDPVTAGSPSFYQLILTNDTARNTDDVTFLPDSVNYNAALDLAELKFSDALYNLAGGKIGTFRLRIGTDEARLAPPVPLDLQGPSAPDNDFRIELRFPDESFTPAQQQLARLAADRWEQIIIGDLPDEGQIDDLEITLLAEPIDGVGHFVANGFPTNLREDSLLPFQGKIVVDSYDLIHREAAERGLGTLTAGGVDYDVSPLSETLTREIGKVLGFGSLWIEHDLVMLEPVNPTYNGPNALREYNRLFNVADLAIPIENITDQQPPLLDDLDNVISLPIVTRFEYWREQFFEPVLPNELMSGFLNDGYLNGAGAVQPQLPDFISRVTVGALEDLGYVVDYNAADSYPGALGGSGFATPYVAPAPTVPTADPGDTFDTAHALGAKFEAVPVLKLTGDGATYADGASITITFETNGGPVVHKFEFVDAFLANGQLDGAAIPLNYNSSGPTTAAAMAAEIKSKIDAQFIPADGVTVTVIGKEVFLMGDHAVVFGGAPAPAGVELNNAVNSAVVIRSSLDPQFYAFDLPGYIDEPGQRDTEFQEHLRGDEKDFTDEITTIYYNFKEHYGFDVQGNPLSNIITDNQKQRAREVFELYGQYLGVQFVETAGQGLTVVTGDLRAVRPTVPTGPGDALGIAGGGMAIMDRAESWDDSYGGDWFQEAIRQIGQVLGLGFSFELPAGTILSSNSPNIGINNQSRVEPVFPGAHDIVHGQVLYRPQQKDIDLYSFVIAESGTFVAEANAERLHNSSTLDTVLTLYRVKTDSAGAPVLDHNGTPVRELVARNDDYFSEDSLLRLDLSPGTYYIGVSAAGNENYNPGIKDSGFGGTSEGDYELRMTFRPQADTAIEDLERVALDGDSDNVPGGIYNFWFRSAPPLDRATVTPQDPAVIYVDKSNQPTTGAPQPNGELTNPFNTIPQALAFINAQRQTEPETSYIVRLVGNGGDDGKMETLTDNIPYEIGFRPPFNTPLPDGAALNVPAGVTVMIDSGAIFKNRLGSINVGSESPSVDRSGGAVQVLGTPFLSDFSGAPILNAAGQRLPGSVYFTSWNDESIGADTNLSTPQTPQGGDWGGLLFRGDQERVEARFDFSGQGIFLNYVNHADMRYGGGKVVINSVQQRITPIHLIEARPTISHNSITDASSGAISADPNSFKESNFHDSPTQFAGLYTSDYDRVGPDVHDNRILRNSTNGMVIRVETPSGGDTIPLTVNARFDDTDIVHSLSENLIIKGTPGGPFLEQVAPDVTLVSFSDPDVPTPKTFSGALTPGANYEYIVVFIDDDGSESPPSQITPSPADNPAVATANPRGLIQLNQLPTVPLGSRFAGRRLYRSVAGADDFRLIDQINGSDTIYIDRGVAGTGRLDRTVTEVTGLRRARLDASLTIDPGTIVKIEGSRIETTVGAQFLAEGRDGREIIFTSRLDDRFGGSGSFDTNGDDAQTTGEAQATPGDWSGLVFGPTSNASLDHVLVTNAGGIGKIGGSFAAFNAIEIHQSDTVRITNSQIRGNEVGQGGQDGQPTSNRFGQGFNAPAAIFVRGSQPIIVGNIIADNTDTNRVDPFNASEVAAISIDVNSLNYAQVFDSGRSTGFVDAFDQYRDNQGPLVRLNRLSGNNLNSMDVRGGVLMTEGVWDDTDITHTLRATVFIPDFHTYGGLRLESSPTESLVVKLESRDPQGNNPLVPDVAGFVATGNQLDYIDRIGGMLHVIGQPGHPVVFTSIHDDTVGAGFRPDGSIQVDVKSDLDAQQGGAAPAPGDWNSIRIDQYANDRNVDIQQELFETADTAAPGINATPDTAQLLGSLARSLKSGDETLRLGFVVNGFINDPQDIDVYSFNADPGTEIWIDIDRTTHSLDTVVELIDSLGQVIARSDDSLLEQNRETAIFEANPPNADIIDANILQKTLVGKKDHWTTNPRDAGLRVVLPGTFDPSAPQPTYHVRVRSSNKDLITPADPALLNGKTIGLYQLQIRLRELDEMPGSTVRFADIRYATNGVEVIGQPSHSPLGGEAVEVVNSQGVDNNGNTTNAQQLGNLLEQDRAVISIAGRLGTPGVVPGVGDLDFYSFSINADNIREITDNNTGGDPLTNTTRNMPVVFDIDYADGFSRANTQLAIYNIAGQLIYYGNDSNVAEDRPEPLNGDDIDNLDRGTIGPLDPFIGPVELPEGTYYAVVHPISRLPVPLRQFQQRNAAVTSTRVEPINSIDRIVEVNFSVNTPRSNDTAYTLRVEHDDDVGVEVDKFLDDTTTQRENINLLDQPGGSNVKNLQVEVFVDDNSAIPFTLSDVTAFSLNDLNQIQTFDPFTGRLETTITTVNDIQDIELGGRDLRSLTQGTTDAAVNWLVIDSGNGAVTATNEGIDTFEHTNGVFGLSERSKQGADANGWGIDFEAVVAAGGGFYGVGNREEVTTGGGVHVNEYWQNILYRFNSSGTAISAPGGDRTSSPDVRHRGAGTQIREYAELFTYTEIQLASYVAPTPGTMYRIEVPSVSGTTEFVDYLSTAADVTANDVVRQIVNNWNAKAAISAPVGLRSFVAEVGESGDAGGLPNDGNVIRLNYVDRGDGAAFHSATRGGNISVSGTLNKTPGTFGPGGLITGLALLEGDLYAVSDAGGLWEIEEYDRTSTGVSTFNRFVANIFNEGGERVQFGGLTNGPSTEDGRYAGYVFGTGGGRMYAFDPSPGIITMPGQLEPVFFDHQHSVPVPGDDGVVFSSLQQNPWGFGDSSIITNSYDPAPDNSRIPILLPPNSGTATGGYSFGNPNVAGGAHGTMETNTFSLAGYTAADQPHLYFDYFLETENDNVTPPGVGGFLDSFRVFITGDGENWSLLTTNNANDAYNGGIRGETLLRDPFEIQETFDNTGVWRQVRVALGDFAGKENLRLRFDFSTAGEMNLGDELTAGDEVRALPGQKIRDGQSFEVRNFNEGNGTRFGAGDGVIDYLPFYNSFDRFEFESGFTIVAPSGAKLQDGDAFDIVNNGVTTTYEFDDDELDGDLTNRFGNGVVAGRIPVPFHDGMSAEEVAQLIQVAVERNYSARVFNAGVINDDGRTVGWDPDPTDAFDPTLTPNFNDTFATAVETNLRYGTGRFTATGTIGDNPNLILSPEDQFRFPTIGAADDVDIYRIRVDEHSRIQATVTGVFGITLFDDEGNVVRVGNRFNPIDYSDTLARTRRTAPQQDDAPVPRISDPFYDIVEAGVYYVAVSSGTFDPQVEFSGDGAAVGVYNLAITVSNNDLPPAPGPAPAVQTPPAPGTRVIYGDDRLGLADISYHYLNAHRDGNRVNIPYAELVAPNTPLPLSGAPNTPFARFIEGTRGVFNGDAANDANVPVYVHNNMSPAEVADAMAYAMADIFTGGDRRLVKSYDETVDFIAHEVAFNDLGPTGNSPGSLGLTRLGVTGDWNNQLLPGDVNGSFFSSARGQNNNIRSITIDNLIIGMAERGEMVFDATSQTAFTPNLYTTPEEIVDGTYQLEIRPGADFAVNIHDEFSGSQSLAPYRSFDTNDRLSLGQVSLNIPAGSQLADEQTFTLSDGVKTLTFEFDDLDLSTPGLGRGGAGVTDASHVRIGFRDFEPADLIAERVVAAINTTAQATLDITASLSDGTVTGANSTSAIVNLYGNVVGNVPDNKTTSTMDVFNPYDFGDISATVHGVAQQRRVEHYRSQPDGSYADVVASQHVDWRVFGDENIERDQGQTLVHSNFITFSQEYGVRVDAGLRASDGLPPVLFPLSSPHPGPARNLDELNTSRLAPGPVVSNNVIAFGGTGGILFAGDPAAQFEQLSVIPYGRIVNNTIYGQGAAPSGIGIDVRNDAGPTLLNNIVANLRTGIRVDAGSLANTIISGTLYNGNTFNIGGSLTTLGDFFINLPLGQPLFVDGPNGNFYLEDGSQAVDSSVASISDRADMRRVRNPLGIDPSSIIAPLRDATGQLRVDDENISTPSGQGPDNAIDRGAIDRSDIDGPTAILINPFDNDGEGLDIDRTGSVVFRPTGVFSNFSIQLIDGLSVGSQVDGVGIDDRTVISNTLTLTRDGKFLQRGIDYTFSYDATSDLIRVNPLSGIWETDSTYVLTLNNRDRYVVTAPEGQLIQDGEQFKVIDQRGAEVVFEYESGHTLQVPQTLTLLLPSAGGGPGGVADGEAFEIRNGPTTIVFELDSNNSLSDNTRTRVPFVAGASFDVLAEAIVNAVAAAGLGLSPSNLGGGRVHIGGTPNHALTILGDGAGNTAMGIAGAPNAIVDGDTFTISPPTGLPVTFEFDLDGTLFTASNTRVPFRLADSQDDIANTLVAVIQSAGLNLTPLNLGGGDVHLGDPAGTVINVLGTSNLTLNGAPGVTSNLRLQVPAAGGGFGGVVDGQRFSITFAGGMPKTFEFDSNNSTTAGNEIISFNTSGSTFSQDQVAGAIVAALLNANIGLNPVNLGGGLVEVGGTVQHLLSIGSANLTLSGVPGGAVPVVFIPDASFTASEMAISILAAIDLARSQGKLAPEVKAAQRGGATLFVEGLDSPAVRVNAISMIGNFYLPGIKDLAQNNLQPNQVSEETRFTALLGDINLDYGDAPDQTVVAAFRYPTRQVDDGARHVVFDNNQLYLGARVDVDQDGVPTLASNGDDLDANSPSAITFDVSGVPSITRSAAATPLELAVPETFFIQISSLGGPGVVDGQSFTVSNGAITRTFEFDRNNALTSGTNTRIAYSLGSTEEGIANAIVAALQASGLGLTPVHLGNGRVHLGSSAIHTLDASLAPSIVAGGVAGSVRDGDKLVVTRGATNVTFEFDSNFSTVLGNQIVRFDTRLTHEQIAQRLTDAIRSIDELGVTPLNLGGGRIDVNGDDEDGVTFNGALNSFLVTPLTVVASGTGLLDAWIDFNRNGTFNDPGEKIFNSVRVVAGANNLTTTTPLTAVPGDTAARFRISTLGGLGPNGLAASGEVEDYQVTIRAGAPPVANNDPGTIGDPAYATLEDVVLTPGPSVIANDSDPDGTTPTVLNPGLPGIVSANGARVVFNADGTFTYDGTSPITARQIQQLPVGAVLNDTFTYRAFDGFLFSNLATVTVTVTGQNDTPTAPDFGGFPPAFEDAFPVNFAFPGDDVDTDDDKMSLTYEIDAAGASEGIVTNNNDGTFRFNPNPGIDFQDLALGETRNATFTYRVTDRHGATSPDGVITITVSGANDRPTVNPVLINAMEDGALVNGFFDGDDVDSDNDGSDLTYRIVGNPLEGEFINNNDGTFSFNPLPASNPNSFQNLAAGQVRDVFATYVAEDRHTAVSLIGTLTARVTGVNDAPTANPDPNVLGAYATGEDTPLVVSNPLQGVLANDVDVDGDPLTVVGATASTPLTFVNTAGATITINQNGTFTYNPTTSATLQALSPGQRIFDTFTYDVQDPSGANSQATVTVRVNGVNDAPISNPVLVSGGLFEDGSPVTGSFDGFDPDGGGTLVYTIVSGSGPAEGKLTNNNNGTFTFDPGPQSPLFLDFQNLAAGATRDVTAQYTTSDGQTIGAPGVITFRVTGRNDAPVAVDDNGGINPVSPGNNSPSTTIFVLDNDRDIDVGDTFDLSSLTITQQGTLGTATPNPDGSVTYTAFQNSVGVDTFRYTIKDNNGAVSNEAIVTITTTQPPVAMDDNAATFTNLPVDITVLSNDNDPDGTLVPSSVAVVAPPANGTAIPNADGTVTYTPASGFTGQDTFTYRVKDNLGAFSNTATVTVDVTVNGTPYRNPRNNLDVFPDGVITPFDAVLIISHLQLFGSALPVGPPPPFIDTVPDDNVITTEDVLAVVVFLILQAEAEGEGEALAGMAPIDVSAGVEPLPLAEYGAPLIDDDRDDESATPPTADPQLADSSQPVHGVPDLPPVRQSDDLEDLLDDLAIDASSRHQQDLIDDALLELLTGRKQA